MDQHSVSNPPPSVRAVCANYARRASWLGARELQQEAAVAMVEAARTWMPGGAPLGAYQAAAVAKRLGRVLASSRAPVSLHRTDSAAVGVPLTRVDGTDTPDVAGVAATSWTSPDGRLDLARAAEEVRRLLWGQHPVAAAVLLEERAPAEVARELRVPARRVYDAVEAAKRALRGSRRLASLCAEGAL
jgi:hypothetical protein